MFCPKCGTENPEGAKFCSKCGAELAPPAGGSETPAMPPAETSIGLQPNIAGLLCYVAGWITGIVFLVIEKKSQFVKFHAWQSIMTFAVLNVAYLIFFRIPVIGWVITWIISILSFVLWIILIIQAGTGKMWKLPLVGDWAEKQASKVS
jgi:uncharacterized membrane protein